MTQPATSHPDTSTRQPIKIGLSGCAGGLETDPTGAVLELAETAERLGFDGLWLNEEHFQGSNLAAEGRRCLSPTILASAILARTTRLRVGFSVLLVPMHHPIRLAEEIATIDVLSSGRVDFGISAGANARYGSVFLPADGTPDMSFQDRVELIVRAWGHEPLSIGNGTYSIEPKPIQQPHPPIYVGTLTDSTAAWAAKRGFSLICHGVTNEFNVRRIVKSFADAGGDPRPVPIGRFVYVSESDAIAREELWPTVVKLTTRISGLGVGSRTSTVQPRDLEPEVFFNEMTIAGSPETCARRIRNLLDDLGSEYFNGLPAFFGFLPMPLLMRSLTLLAGEVRQQLVTAAEHTL